MATEIVGVDHFTTTFAGSGTAARVYSGTNPAIRKPSVAIIQAHPSNTGNLYVGGSAVTSSGSTQGLLLQAGDVLNLSQFLDKKRSGVLDLKNIWINNSTSGDKFTVLYDLPTSESNL